MIFNDAVAGFKSQVLPPQTTEAGYLKVVIKLGLTYARCPGQAQLETKGGLLKEIDLQVSTAYAKVRLKLTS